jgi:hypothetical protein
MRSMSFRLRPGLGGSVSVSLLGAPCFCSSIITHLKRRSARKITLENSDINSGFLMNKEAKIYVAGHRGLVGSAILRQLKREGYENIITRNHQELDLIRPADVEKFFEEEKPEYIFLAAARVGGIYANSTYKADFIYQNTQVQNNVIHQSYVHGVKNYFS